MKKPILLILLCALGCLQLKAEKKKLKGEPVKEASISPFTAGLAGGSSKGITEGGFFVHFGGVLPSKNYYILGAFGDNDTGEKFGFGPSLDLGNMFRIADLDDAAFGIRVTWFSALYTKLAIDDTTSLDVMQGSVLKAGPYFTYGFSDDAAIDVYYQIAPAVLIELNDGDSNLGVAHSLGLGFRFKVLSVGMDYNFGNLKNIDFPVFKVPTNHLRMFIGVKI